ncbi:Ferredoxin--NADP reductase 2 [Paraliobacillus sp. PM-2]|uniref:NAD(P)/FAD-dependent oxidoreductase n=1 Tax=Paraliobacillus sp. PM-2 TaxID=1462524 RepID=UPI00061BEFF9|nr:NAD(P)/FAD-dependent oxidoreductase [Paraliobacillus sp. PM-2]CQR48387.1 Ferredoxin--NADP reductase 2 [Paraliobacillus sp. PM-2]
MDKDLELYDVTIIGGGTTGLYAAFYSGLREMKTKLIEASSHFGGKVALFYPEKNVYDLGAMPGATGEEIVQQTMKQAHMFDPTMIHNQWVETIEKKADGTFFLTTAGGEIHWSKTIILAAGNGEFSIVGPELFDVKKDENVHTTMENWKQYEGKRVVIFTNSRIGLDWACKIESIAKQVYVCNQKTTYQKAKEKDFQRLAESSIKEQNGVILKEVSRQHNQVKEVMVVNSNGVEERIVVDDVLVYEGIEQRSAPSQAWGLDTEQGRVLTNTEMTTNIEGLFVAGDTAIYPGKTNLIATGYTEAMAAVNSAKRYINPKASAQIYTTVIFRDKN